MKKGTKITIGAVAGVVIVGGALLYIFRDKIFNKGAKYDKPPVDDGGGDNSSSAPHTPQVDDKPKDVRDFQSWVHARKLLGEVTIGAIDGIFGSKTRAAWRKWKNEYLSDTDWANRNKA